MGLLSRFHARRREEPRSAENAPPRAGERWRRGDFSATPLAEGEHAVHVRGDDPRVWPAFVVEFVYGCEKFLPLEQHVAAHAEKHGWDALQAAALREYLPQLAEGRVLVSTDDLRRQAEAGAPEEPPAPIEALGISTGGDRLELLMRCLGSFAANLRTHGRKADLLISDNSASERQAEQCRAALAAWQRGSGATVRFAGAVEKRAFAESLVRAGACSPEVAEFALFDPTGAGFSCGANRNALLLHEAGRMFGSLDDDVICRLSAPLGGAGEGLSLFSDGDPYSRWWFADRETARAAAITADADYLGGHERLLGLPLAGLLKAQPQPDFSAMGDDLVRRLGQRPTRIRATFFGHIGDPGIPSSAYYLFCRGENRRRLVQSDAAYEPLFRSRSIAALAPQPSVGDASISPGMAMCLDHRTLLPPFFPVLHAEDFSFSAALWQCCPEALLGHLPLAVAHEPTPGKPILAPADLAAARPFVVFEFAHLLRRLLFHCSLPPAAEVETRMLLLGRYFEEIGAQSPADFRDLLRREAIAEASARIEYLHRELHEAEESTPAWRRDVEAVSEHLRTSLSAAGFEIPLDLPTTRSDDQNRAFMQLALGNYGALLRAWPAMVQTARALRDSGSPLMPLLAG